MDKINIVDESVINGLGSKLIETYYKFNDRPVPRVTHILRSTIGSEELIRWAAKVGKFKYDMIRDKAFEVGNLVHEAIDDYLSGKMNFFETIEVKSDNQSSIDKAQRAVKNFLCWEASINSRGYMVEDIIGIEVPVITPWYGGTIDAILKINGANYIVDFKTSNAINFEYPLQVCAYMYGLDNGFCDIKIPIHGIGIIRVSKYRNEFEDYFLNKHIPTQADHINQYTNCFLQLVNAYYYQNNCRVLTSDYKIGFIESNERGEHD